MKRIDTLTTMALMLALLSLPLAASTPQERGLEIAQEADRRDTGWGDQSAGMRMTLRNRHGQETSRDLRTKTLEQADDGDKTQIIFDNPGDVKGTAFLSYTHREGQDDQWLYLPALKRVKRIASSNKSGPFVGSEFAYEDIASQEVDKYSYRYLRDETIDGRDHFVIERDPIDPKSGYTVQIVWIDQQEYRPWKVEFFDRGGALLKTLTYHDYSEYMDDYWRPARMSMINHQTGKSTDLIWSDYTFGNGFDDNDFSRNSLSKAR
jgi:outer membrane lipoprotein-sorting protein